MIPCESWPKPGLTRKAPERKLRSGALSVGRIGVAGRATLSLHFQMDGFVELRLYQTGNIHRIREVQIFHILSEEGEIT